MSLIRQDTLDALTRLRDQPGRILRFALVFEVLRLVALAPLGAGALRVFLEVWGRCSVGNFEIAAFFLSAPGLAALVAVGTAGLTTFYLEIAGLMLLLEEPTRAWWAVFPALAKRLRSVLGLGLRQSVILLALALPVLALIALVLRTLWADRDLNALIVLKPPVFWKGVIPAVLLIASYAAAAGLLLLRWLAALPTMLFEPNIGPAAAMRLSGRRSRGRLFSIAAAVIVLLLVVFAASALVTGGLRLGSDWLLDRIGMSLTALLPATAALLVLYALIGVALSAMGNAAFAAMMLTIYRRLRGDVLPPSEAIVPRETRTGRLPSPWTMAGAAAALTIIIGGVCYGLLARVRLRDRLEITAHRGGAAVAPENTVAAIREAILARADWAEIDVQRTADGSLVVLHDSDLVRIGGLHRRVAESTLDEIRSVDAGAHFGRQFQGEPVPTLDEVIAAAGNRIRLNIEIKPSSREDMVPLVNAVLDSLRRAGITDQCRLCSQSYEGLQLARRSEPGLQVGFIAGARLGDLSRLEVNFLMVAGRLATRRLVESATARGLEVHAWTINDPDQLSPLLDRGVSNVITDNPAAMRRRLEEIQALSPAERLLLRARNLLAD